MYVLCKLTSVCPCTHVYLHAAMKKVKHRLVEKMNESTADSLGLSRAVLVNGMLHASLVHVHE